MKKTNFKKLISLIMAFAVIAIALPIAAIKVNAADTNIIDSGQCGEKAFWALDKDGLLTISGEGNINDSEERFPAPWANIKDQIKKLVINDKITTIGNYAFNYCSKLTDINIADSVIRFGEGAFKDCTSLKNIKLPAKAYYDRAVFQNCSSLTDIEIPEGSTAFTTGMFANCTSLKNVNIPDSFTNIGFVMFDNCTSLETITLPENIKDIEQVAFNNCTSLKTITFNDTLERILDEAFCNCSALKELEFPDTLKYICGSAFENCISLEKVIFSKNLENLESKAFKGCTSFTDITIPDKVNSISELAFADCTSLKSITLPDSLNTHLSGNIFQNCSSLKDVYFNGTAQQWEHMSYEFTKQFSDNVTIHISNPFYDIYDGQWYKDAVLECYKKGYMSGISKNAFSPDSNLTRAMLVTILAKIDGQIFSTEDYTEMSYADVSANTWFSKPVEWAYQSGYVAGTGNLTDGTPVFSPNDDLTREQLLRILCTYSEKKGHDTTSETDLSSYKDANEISPWAHDAVLWGVSNGLIAGRTENTIVPKGTATRAEIATIVRKYSNTFITE